MLGSEYNKSDIIGDIKVVLRCDDTIDMYIVSVSCKGHPLERLEYPGNRQAAMNEYNMLSQLMRKVAAIHPLI